MPRRRAARRARRRNPRRPSAPRRLRGKKSSQVAYITETIEYSNIDANNSYFTGFTLAQFNRACSLCPNFRWYKPLSVTYTYNPIYNTFQNTSGAAGTPYLYMAMNRTQDNHIYNRFDLQAQGAKPIRFNKPITKTYKPNWCSSGLIVAGQSGSPDDSIHTAQAQGLRAQWGWLQSPPAGANSNPSTTAPVPVFPDTQGIPAAIAPAQSPSSSATMLPVQAANTMFNGHDTFIQQDNAISGQDVARLTVTVRWAFKDPQNTSGLNSLRVLQPKGEVQGLVA